MTMATRRNHPDRGEMMQRRCATAALQVLQWPGQPLLGALLQQPLAAALMLVTRPTGAAAHQHCHSSSSSSSSASLAQMTGANSGPAATPHGHHEAAPGAVIMVDPQTAAPCCSRSAARCQQRRGPLVTADRARLEPLMGPHEALWRGGAGCTPAHPSPLLLRRLPAQHAATGTSSQQQQQHHHHQGSWRHLTTAAQRGVPHAPSSTAPAVLGTTPTPPPSCLPPQWAQSIG